jgi:hypothetical protein
MVLPYLGSKDLSVAKKAKQRLTQRALDWWDSVHFQALRAA